MKSDRRQIQYTLAFDPKRQAVLLVAGDKTGGSERKFYKELIDKADARYARHIEGLKPK